MQPRFGLRRSWCSAEGARRASLRERAGGAFAGARARAALACTALACAAVACAAVVCAALLVGVAATAGAQRHAGAPKALTAPPILYRIVGCHSHGDMAYRHGRYANEVAIGFDDGPAALTPAFVRMLERARAPATFFLIGGQIRLSDRSTLLRELRDGDALGDHTFTHPDLLRSANVTAQLSQTMRAIRSLTGYTPCVFRPPYGAYDQSIVNAARALGLATISWNVDPADWATPGADAIVQRVEAQVRPGSIILSHDGGGPRAQTLAAYPRILAALRRRGFRIVTIPQLLGFRPVYVPCIRLCEGIGLPRRALPRDALIKRAPA